MVPKEKAQTSNRRELVDTLFALTGHAFFAELRSGGLSADRACKRIEDLAFDALARTNALRETTPENNRDRVARRSGE